MEVSKHHKIKITPKLTHHWERFILVVCHKGRTSLINSYCNLMQL